jgi:molybdate transport system substrate-binding protein
MRIAPRRGTHRHSWLMVVATLAVALLVFQACGGDDNDSASSDPTTTTTKSDLQGNIKVFAAASLTEAFTDLAKRFETVHPGTSVSNGLNFAASSDLVESISEGAPADVFASADTTNMDKVVSAGEASGTPVTFARNKLAIAVEKGNPKNIQTLPDLAKPGVSVVLCAATVPCGKYADAALQKAGVTVNPVSREANVKDTLGKVGEADAAIVYVTDVKSDSDIDGVTIPDDQNEIATLPIVALKATKNAGLAKAWVDYVGSAAAQQILVDKYGFLPPTGSTSG